MLATTMKGGKFKLLLSLIYRIKRHTYHFFKYHTKYGGNEIHNHSPTLIYRKNIFECCSTVKKKHQILKRSCTSSWPLAQNSPYNNLSAEHNPIVRVEKRHSTSGL